MPVGAGDVTIGLPRPDARRDFRFGRRVAKLFLHKVKGDSC
jgi:hypothetical protein